MCICSSMCKRERMGVCAHVCMHRIVNVYVCLKRYKPAGSKTEQMKPIPAKKYSKLRPCWSW